MVSVSWSHGPADPGRDPATAGQHALLLYLNFRVLTETLIVMLSLPFALVGGIWLMWWLGFNSPSWWLSDARRRAIVKYVFFR